MKQFESVQQSLVKTTTKIQGEEIKETAGQVKKQNREQKKKEKTLGAKLRLKAKKNK